MTIKTPSAAARSLGEGDHLLAAFRPRSCKEMDRKLPFSLSRSEIRSVSTLGTCFSDHGMDPRAKFRRRPPHHLDRIVRRKTEQLFAGGIGGRVSGSSLTRVSPPARLCNGPARPVCACRSARPGRCRPSDRRAEADRRHLAHGGAEPDLVRATQLTFGHVHGAEGDAESLCHLLHRTTCRARKNLPRVRRRANLAVDDDVDRGRRRFR